MIRDSLDLSAVGDTFLRGKAPEYFASGEIGHFVHCAYPSDRTLDLVVDNWKLLQARGMLEKALIHAYTGCKYNHCSWPTDAILGLFLQCNLERLRAVGEPLPGPGPFTVYRGVSGLRPYRKVKGLSWTLCPEVACNFALSKRKADPGVYVGKMRADDVLCFWNERGEKELIGSVLSCKRLIVSSEEMEAATARVRANIWKKTVKPAARL